MMFCGYGEGVRAGEVPPARTDVVVVGAGPVGLTLALLLRRSGIDVVVLEARDALSRHPRARGIAARSMEAFRGLGLEGAVRDAALPDDDVRFYRGRTLLDPDGVVGPPPPTRGAGSTPSPGVLCSQDRLEPILLEAARAAGATVAFAHRVTAVAERSSGVRVAYDVAGAGPPGVVACSAVVGCDGVGSTVRHRVGIDVDGRRDLGTFLSVRFSAGLGERVAGRRAASYFLAPGFGGFLAVDNDREWIYQYPVPPGTDAEALRRDASSVVALVHAALGTTDVAVDVRSTMPWRMGSGLARTFRCGRTLLAGDAAHQVPPTGGHGLNLGIGDAEGLAWRLARVVRGTSPERLLDHYAEERRSVAAAVAAICVDNGHREYGIDDELLLGTTYGAEPPVTAEPYRPCGRPGRRLPHVALRGDVTSTLDLVGGGPAIVLESPSPAWADAASATPALREVEVVSCVSASRGEVVAGDVARRCRLGPGEGLLVRPDGHVVARVPRVPTAAAVADLAAAWARELGVGPPTPPSAARSRPS